MDRDAMTSAADLSEDAFLGGALRLMQPARGYRAGVDAVLLAAAAPVSAGRGEHVLDVGAGVGTVGLCVARRVDDAAVWLLERDPILAELARQNIVLNRLDPRCRVVVADVGAPGSELQALGILPHSFAHVLANPPFHEDGRGTPAADAGRARAHAMTAGELDIWARFMARMTAAHGTVTVVHKAEAIGPLLSVLERRFGALRVLPIQPRAAAPAIRVIVQGVRGSRAPLTLLPPLILHDVHGHGFTPPAEAILKHGAALPLG
jgi:tRNA1(Val) A37 N6-methylase TrmN6